ncbi:hypothetical protein [Campylobacter concisus]
MATRQLTGYSGNDLYINLTSINEITELFNKISNSSSFSVNNKETTYNSETESAYFRIFDPILNKYFEVHIKDNRHRDGLWFRLTKYIQYQKIIPGQFLVLNITINEHNAKISIYGLELYRYIMQKCDNYYILMSDIDTGESYNTIAGNYLKNFNILRTDTIIKRRYGSFFAYNTDRYSKKYIGVPYNTNLECDEFNGIGDIII